MNRPRDTCRSFLRNDGSISDRCGGETILTALLYTIQQSASFWSFDGIRSTTRLFSQRRKKILTLRNFVAAQVALGHLNVFVAVLQCINLWTNVIRSQMIYSQQNRLVTLFTEHLLQVVDHFCVTTSWYSNPTFSGSTAQDVEANHMTVFDLSTKRRWVDTQITAEHLNVVDVVIQLTNLWTDDLCEQAVVDQRFETGSVERLKRTLDILEKIRDCLVLGQNRVRSGQA